MTDLNFLAVIAADLSNAKGGADKAAAKYETRLKVAFDALTANGVALDLLTKDGETRTAWRDAIAVAYLTAAELKLYRGTGARKDKNLVADGNKEGQTKRGGICTRVEKRANDIAKDLIKVAAADGETTEEKVAAAKKGANANKERDLGIRVQEELSKLIKAIDKDAAAETPKKKKHGEAKKALEATADLIAKLWK